MLRGGHYQMRKMMGRTARRLSTRRIMTTRLGSGLRGLLDRRKRKHSLYLYCEICVVLSLIYTCFPFQRLHPACDQVCAQCLKRHVFVSWTLLILQGVYFMTVFVTFRIQEAALTTSILTRCWISRMRVSAPRDRAFLPFRPNVLEAWLGITRLRKPVILFDVQKGWIVNAVQTMKLSWKKASQY